MSAVALLHFSWGRGSHWPAASSEALARAAVGDGRRRMPSPGACFAVAAVLLAMALWPLICLQNLHEVWANQISAVIAGLLVARGVGGFTPRWRAFFHDEPFATLDRRYYSPLCIVLGLGYAAFVSGDFVT
jgi:pyruvate dehydrogenase complex dehydrogenase (E1) component